MHRAALVGLIVLTGCQHAHLRHNTVHQAKTLSDVYEQQVLDNLARTVHDAHAIPFFAYPDEGSASITDSANASASPIKQIENVLGLTFSREGLAQWGLSPVSDPKKLQLMQCAYQRSIYGLPLDECSACCELENKFEGRVATKIRVKNRKLCKCEQDSDYRCIDTVCNPETGLPYIVNQTDEGRFEYQHSDGKNYLIDSDGYATVPPDCDGSCAITCGWVHHGSRSDLPRDCCGLVGHHCGTYVWIDKCHRQHLSQLTLKILDYAINDAAVVSSREKKVKVKVDRFGRLTENDGLAVGTVTATIGIEDQISSVLTVDECGLLKAGTDDDGTRKKRSEASSKRILSEADQIFKANPSMKAAEAKEKLRNIIDREIASGIKTQMGATPLTPAEPSKVIYPKSRTVRPSDYGVSPIDIQRGQRAIGRP